MKKDQLQTHTWAGLPALAVLGLLVATVVPSSRAAEVTWNGAEDGTTMSHGGNWVGGVAPVGGVDSIVFAGSTGLSVNNDYAAAAGSAFAGITFSSGAGAFTISGNAIYLSGGITNNSTSLQYFPAIVEFNAASRTFNAAAGPMQFDVLNGRNSFLIKDGTNIVTLSGTVDNNGLLAVVTNGILVLAKQGPAATVHAIGGSTPLPVYTNAILRIGPTTNTDQIYRNVALNGQGGTIQLQNPLEAVRSLVGWTNSLNSIVENGLVDTTNLLRLGDGSNKRGIYNGAIRNGSAGVLSLEVFGNTMEQFGGSLTYSGTTSITNVATGTSRIIVDGTHIGGGDYTVSGRTAAQLSALNGRGLISATLININTNAALGPGGALSADGDGAVFSDNTAILTLSNTVVNLNDPSSKLDVQINGSTAGSGYDQVAIVGSGSLSNNNANLNLNFGFVPAVGSKFTIVKVPGTASENNVGVFGSLNGVAADLSQGVTNIDLVSGANFRISYRAEGSTFDPGAGNGNDIMIEILGTTGANLTWRGNVNNAWDVATTANWRSNGIPNTPRSFGATDNAFFDDTGSNSLPIDLTTALSPANITVNATNDYQFATSAGGKLTGIVVLTKANTGTLTIVTDNDNSGATIIQRGTLQIGTNGITGTVSGNISVNTNGVLAFNRSDDITFSTAAFGGTGGFVHNGGGMLTIAADMTAFAGNATNTGGLLQFGDGNGIVGQIAGTVYVYGTNEVRYLFGGSGTPTALINNALGGNGTINYQSANTPTMNIATTAASSNFTGTAILSSGVRLHAQNGSSYAYGNGSTVNVPFDSQAWCDNASTPYNNIFNIAGNGWDHLTGSPIPPPTGAISVFNATFTGAINLMADARIGGTISGGSILCPISGSYQLEVWGTLGSYVLSMGPTNGVHSYASTLLTSGTIRALNTNAISTGPLTMDVAADLRLNGNNLTVASLTSINSGQVTGTGATVQNIHASTPATLTVGTDNSSTAFDGIFTNGGNASLGLTKVGSGTLTLSGISSNTGTITVNGGTLALTGSGSFGNAARIIVGSGAFYDVTGTGGALTLNSGQTLGGSGRVNGDVIALSGSTIAPGTSVGTLTVAGNVTLGGGMTMELNRSLSPNSDRLLTSGGGTITGGGTLTPTNTGPVLQVGNTFQLFASGVSGITLASQTVDKFNGVVYTWQNNLASSGSISVASVTLIPRPPIGYSQSGSTLTFSWTDPYNAGFKLQSQTNSLNVGVSTNWSDYSGRGSSPVNVTIDPNSPTVFFRLSLQ